MSNHFPTLPDGVHIAGVQYVFSISGTFTNIGVSPVSPPVSICDFGFDTGVDGSGNPTYSYDSFDQDTVESEIATFLDAYGALAVALSGCTLAQFQAQVTVTRQWGAEGDAVLSDTYTPTSLSFEFTDQMAYPAA